MAILSTHANIVRYYGTWLEEAPPDPPRNPRHAAGDDDEEEEEEGTWDEEGTWEDATGTETAASEAAAGGGGGGAAGRRVTWLYIQAGGAMGGRGGGREGDGDETRRRIRPVSGADGALEHDMAVTRRAYVRAYAYAYNSRRRTEAAVTDRGG